MAPVMTSTAAFQSLSWTSTPTGPTDLQIDCRTQSSRAFLYHELDAFVASSGGSFYELQIRDEMLVKVPFSKISAFPSLASSPPAPSGVLSGSKSCHASFTYSSSTPSPVTPSGLSKTAPAAAAAPARLPAAAYIAMSAADGDDIPASARASLLRKHRLLRPAAAAGPRTSPALTSAALQALDSGAALPCRADREDQLLARFCGRQGAKRAVRPRPIMM